MKFLSVFNASILAFSMGAVLLPQKALAFSGGTGTNEDPYLVSSCTEMISISSHLNAAFRLTADLDCSDQGDAMIIGNAGAAFTGIFDGNNKKITINIESSSWTGLFAYLNEAEVFDLDIAGVVSGTERVGSLASTADSSTITNVSSSADVTGTTAYIGGLVGSASYSEFENSDATGDVAGDSAVGGFVGSTGASTFTGTYATGDVDGGSSIGGFAGASYCSSEHNDSYASGNVTAGGSLVGGYTGADGCEGPGSIYHNVIAMGDVSGNNDVGGFSGNAPQTTHYRTFANGNVTAIGGNAGGLIGVSYYNLTVDESGALGNVTAGGVSAGGLIGRMNHGTGTIRNSFARGDVESSNNAGGLVGSAQGGSNILNTYSTGTSLATDDGEVNQGGLVGETQDNSNMDYSFWDTQASGNESSAGGIGKLTAEMKQESTYTTDISPNGWDFDETWQIASDVNDGYPCLQWLGENCGARQSQNKVVGDLLLSNGDSGQPVGFVAKGCSSLDQAKIVQESKLADKDVAFNYPIGLVSFTLSGCDSKVRIELSIPTAQKPSKGVIRKYLESTGSFMTLNKSNSDLKVTVSPYGGSDDDVNLLNINYTISDGGVLDADGEVNGSISDPVGFAKSQLTVPNTGFETSK